MMSFARKAVMALLEFIQSLFPAQKKKGCRFLGSPFGHWLFFNFIGPAFDAAKLYDPAVTQVSQQF